MEFGWFKRNYEWIHPSIIPLWVQYAVNYIIPYKSKIHFKVIQNKNILHMRKQEMSFEIEPGNQNLLQFGIFQMDIYMDWKTYCTRYKIRY